MNDPVSANTRAAGAAAGSKVEQNSEDILGVLGPFMDQMREMMAEQLADMRFKTEARLSALELDVKLKKEDKEESDGDSLHSAQSTSKQEKEKVYTMLKESITTEESFKLQESILQRAMQYSADATQSKDDSPPETRTPTEASTEQLARKKQQEGAAQASRAVRASEPVQQPLGEGQLEARKAKCEGFTATTNLPPAPSPSNSPPNIARPPPRTGLTKQTTQWTPAYRSGDQAYTLEYATPTPEAQPPPLSLRTDARRFGWGAILLQRAPRSKLTPSQLSSLSEHDDYQLRSPLTSSQAAATTDGLLDGCKTYPPLSKSLTAHYLPRKPLIPQ